MFGIFLKQGMQICLQVMETVCNIHESDVLCGLTDFCNLAPVRHNSDGVLQGGLNMHISGSQGILSFTAVFLAGCASLAAPALLEG